MMIDKAYERFVCDEESVALTERPLACIS